MVTCIHASDGKCPVDPQCKTDASRLCVKDQKMQDKVREEQEAALAEAAKQEKEREELYRKEQEAQAEREAALAKERADREA
jgi:hypothetical protein